MKRRTGDSPSARSADPARSANREARPVRLVAAGEHSAGFVGFDELGRPRWSWMNELVETPEGTDADDVLEALDTGGLSLAEDSGAASVPRPGKDEGYDPYDTARIKIGAPFRRR